jgi:hypothetical protein
MNLVPANLIAQLHGTGGMQLNLGFSRTPWKTHVTCRSDPHTDYEGKELQVKSPGKIRACDAAEHA